MKKLLIIFIVVTINFSLFSQNIDLYNVNYDQPKEFKSHENEEYEFQNIYLQYESALNTEANVIKKTDKVFYQTEIEKIKQTESKRANDSITQIKAEYDKLKQEELKHTKDSIDQARVEIYNSEIQSVRQQETERLTQELSEKLTKDLTTKISLEYESKKKEDLKVLEKKLRKTIYKETATTTTRIKYIFFSISLIVIFIIVVVIIHLVSNKYKSNKQSREQEQEQIELFTSDYLDKLETHRGESGSIRAEIDQYKGKEKNQANKAFECAKKQYEKIRSLEGWKKDLVDFDEKFNSIHKVCIQNANDLDFINSQIKNFEVNINNFNKVASEAFNSNSGISDDDRKDFVNHHFNLENSASLIEGIRVNDKKLMEKLRKVATKYRKCAKIFEKGKI